MKKLKPNKRAGRLDEAASPGAVELPERTLLLVVRAPAMGLEVGDWQPGPEFLEH